MGVRIFLGLAIFGLLLIAKLHTNAFFAIFIAFRAAFGFLFAVLGQSLIVQLVAFALSAAFGLAAIRGPLKEHFRYLGIAAWYRVLTVW
jgi:hypothetical protein